MTQVDARNQRSTLYWAVVYLVAIAAVLVAAYFVAQRLVPTPKIGIIEVTTQVDGRLADTLALEIDYARHARDIKGVVLVINSPGGSASAGHDIYYQLRKLRETKPIVASMDGLAASAGYQIGVAANEIYAKPASIVGNVGVIFQQPRPEVLSEQFLTTGPFKTTGGSSTSYLRKLDMLYADFRDSVMAERSHAPNPIKLSAAELATGEIWVGVEAKEYGIIDELGSKLDAIDAAVRLANIKNYEVVNVRDEYLASLTGQQYLTALERYEELAQEEVKFDLSSEETEWPAFYQLYIPLE